MLDTVWNNMIIIIAKNGRKYCRAKPKGSRPYLHPYKVSRKVQMSLCVRPPGKHKAFI